MGTWIVGTIVAGLIIWTVRKMIRDKKQGKSLHCGGNCAQCKRNCKDI